MRWTIFFISLCLTNPLAARVYQWKDPDSGTAYMSGEPPAWYRTSQGGPRVLVLEEGKVVDDTEWYISQERERTLREKALKEVKDRKQEEVRLKEEEEARRKQEEALAALERAKEDAAKEMADAEESDAVAIFRTLIKEWDKQQDNTAKVPGESGKRSEDDASSSP